MSFFVQLRQPEDLKSEPQEKRQEPRNREDEKKGVRERRARDRGKAPQTALQCKEVLHGHWGGCKPKSMVRSCVSQNRSMGAQGPWEAPAQRQCSNRIHDAAQAPSLQPYTGVCATDFDVSNGSRIKFP